MRVCLEKHGNFYIFSQRKWFLFYLIEKVHFSMCSFEWNLFKKSEFSILSNAYWSCLSSFFQQYHLKLFTNENLQHRCNFCEYWKRSNPSNKEFDWTLSESDSISLENLQSFEMKTIIINYGPSNSLQRSLFLRT